MRQQKFRCTKRIVQFGGSWAVTLNKYMLPKKNFQLGDVVKVTLEHLDEKDVANRVSATEVSKMMEERGVDKLIIRKEKTIDVPDGLSTKNVEIAKDSVVDRIARKINNIRGKENGDDKKKTQ